MYQVVNPVVSFRMYWPEVTFLLLAISTPVVTWFAFHDGETLGRSGSVVVFFAAVAEFFTLNRANKKHILNACRAKNGETPWDFSRPAKIVGFISFIVGLIGTILWGYGDLIVHSSR